MSSYARLGPWAFTLGLTHTATYLGADAGCELPELTGLDRLDPANPDYALSALGQLTEAPYDPRLIQRLLDDGYFDACPVTGSYLADTVLKKSLWPDTFADLTNELRYLRRFTELYYPSRGPLAGSEIDAPQKVLDFLWNFYQECGLRAPTAPASALDEITCAKQSYLQKLMVGPDPMADRRARNWLIRAGGALPDWESFACLRHQGDDLPPADLQTHSLGAFKLGWLLRNCGLDEVALPLLRGMSQMAAEGELLWLLMEIAADLGQNSVVESVGAQLTSLDATGSIERDTVASTRARIAAIKGDPGGVSTALKEVATLLAKDHREAARLYPRATLLAIEQRVRQDEDVTAADLETAFLAHDACQEWPVSNRLLLTMGAAFNLGRDKVEQAFGFFDDSVARLPANPTFWTSMANLGLVFPQVLPPLVERLVAHIERHPLLHPHWQLLSKLALDEGLRQSLSQDLEDRAVSMAATTGSRPGVRARLAAKARSVGLVASAQRLAPAAAGQGSLDPALPLAVKNWLGSAEIDSPNTSAIFVSLQKAPFHVALLQRLAQMGFFEAMPAVGALAARACLLERAWDVEPPESITRAAQFEESLFESERDLRELLCDCIAAAAGDVPAPKVAHWARALAAKREFAKHPERAPLAPLQQAVEAHGDVEAALILATRGQLRGPYPPILNNLLMLRTAGFVEATAILATRFFNATLGGNSLFFAVDALLTLGKTESAQTLVERFLAKHAGEAWTDLPQAAVMRVSLEQGKTQAVLDGLRALEERVAADLEQTCKSYPNSLSVLVDAYLSTRGQAPQTLFHAVLGMLRENAFHPYTRAVGSAAIAASALPIEAEEFALRGLIDARRDTPGEVDVFTRVASVMQRNEAMGQHLTAHLEAHVEQYGYLWRMWDLLACLNGDPSLRDSLGNEIPRTWTTHATAY